ncbi:MAG: DUF6636 domain-containing protein [bacterium]
MWKLAVAATLLASPALADDFIYFHTPSDNIHCMMVTGDYAAVRCDMIALTKSFPKRPADCDLDWGDAFEVGQSDRRGHVVCHGDTVINPDSMQLGYGASTTLGDFTCTSEKTGMTCTNARGHGFSIAKAAQQLF